MKYKKIIYENKKGQGNNNDKEIILFDKKETINFGDFRIGAYKGRCICQVEG